MIVVISQTLIDIFATNSVVGIELVLIIASARHAVAVVVVLETVFGPAKTVRSQLKTNLTSRTRVFSGQAAVKVFLIHFA